MTCPVCGGDMHGDGYKTPLICENATMRPTPMSSSRRRVLSEIPEYPSYETVKPILAVLLPTWKVPERLHDNASVKSMVRQGWQIDSYQLLAPDFCEVLFRRYGPDDHGRPVTVKGVFIDPIT